MSQTMYEFVDKSIAAYTNKSVTVSRCVPMQANALHKHQFCFSKDFYLCLATI